VQTNVLNQVLKIWWPLALSWLFMGLEQPLISAIIARLPDSTIHLAALGGVVFPLALIIESPIIMLLTASTALSDHQQAYKRIYRFMMITSAILTAFHALLAFTPLYDVLIVGTLNPPAEIIEPSRWGLMLLLPWTWSIAHRRFQQGLLIRYGDAKAISVGTLFRLIASLGSMGLMASLGYPGIVVAAIGISAGVLTEALFIAWRARPIIQHRLPTLHTHTLSWKAFNTFYTPLALTSFLVLVAQPLGSAALSRMPEALNSLAAWPVLISFIFLFRGLGFAYNEVVVTMLKDKKATFADLSRFALRLSIVLTALLATIAFTPLAQAYFSGLAGLDNKLTSLIIPAFSLCVLWPALSVFLNLYQGVIVFGGQTRFVTESVMISLIITAGLLILGVVSGRYPGLIMGVIAFLVGNIAQVIWLVWRSQSTRIRLNQIKNANANAN
jgi:hypothetical protein